LSNDFIDRVTPTQTGSHYPATSDSAVFAEAIVLPPIAEQRRIVAELEQLLAKSDDCQERLSNISTCLRRFRRSVLAAACSGRLTADWREKHPNKIGIDKMLAAIRHRQETSAKTMAQKARIKDIYSVAEENDSDQLPDHWRFIRLNKLAVSFDYGTSAKSQTKGKVPVLRMGNIQNGRIDWSDLVYTSNREEILQYSLSPQTVLFNRTNSPELVGKTAIYRGERPAIFAGYLIRVNPQPELDPEYLNLCLNTSNAKEFCSSIKTDGVSQSNINAQKLGAFEVPFCSPAEQKEIVSRVEGLFGLAEKIEARYKIAQQVVDRLSQSIIAKAFRGELVPTEAELAEREGRPYESAEELLNRIRRSSKGEVGLRDAGTRTAQNPQIIDGISLDGFSEAIIIDKLRETRCAQVPEKSGIYLIIRSSVSEPHFLRKSTGGWFKGLDPSYPIKVVHENWVDGAHVMYVGMTAADGGLRSRLCQFFDFGSGKRVGHRGGRLLWHLEDSGELLVRWRTCAANKADSAETAAITSFKSVHDDRRPFANMAK
jgi:restriction endonuclease S subunit